MHISFRLFLCALLIALIVLFSNTSTGQTPDKGLAGTGEADSILAVRGEICFSFEIASRDELHKLTDIVSIHTVKGGTVCAYANQAQFARFLELGYRFSICGRPEWITRKAFTAPVQEDGWDFYPSYSRYESMMRNFADRYPAICRLDTIGVLNSGHRLLALRISTNINNRENKPRVLFTSSMHGNETSGYILTLHLADYLLSRYSNDERARRIIDSVELWINPLSNPNGTYPSDDSTIVNAKRYNAFNIDLNRNYKDPEDGDHPDGNEWQEETLAFMRLAASYHYTLSLSFHDGSELYNYPWDTWIRTHPDDDWWRNAARSYADTVHSHGKAGYFTDEEDGITNGYAWYEVNGGRQDFMNYFHHTREATVEIYGGNIVDPAMLPELWEAQYRSMLAGIELSLTGLRGIITDSLTGLPLYAQVTIENHDADESEVYSELPIGDYHRLIMPGKWTMICSAPGYRSKRIEGVVVSDGPALVLDIQLAPLRPTAAFSTDDATSCDGVVRFVNESVGANAVYNWGFGDGTTSTEKDPVHVYTCSGVYDVTLTVSNAMGKDSVDIAQYITVQLPDAPQPVVADRCFPGPASVISGGPGTTGWFRSVDQLTPSFIGDTLAFAMLDSDTILYMAQLVESAVEHAGKTDTLGTGGYFTSSNSHYLIFNAERDFTLKAATVYAKGTSNRTLELRDSQGTILFDTTLTVADGKQRIVFDAAVPKGNGLRIGVTGHNNLFRNSNGAQYPYTVPGLVSITGNTASDSDYYYFLYDWEIQAGPCISAKVPAKVMVSTSAPLPSFHAEYAGMTVRFVNESSRATAYLWSFGDGSTSELELPVHAYQSTGQYLVVLRAFNACGVDSISIPIDLSKTGLEPVPVTFEASVHPNPASRAANVELRSDFTGQADLRIIDALGRCVKYDTGHIHPGNNHLHLDLSGLSCGTYYVVIFGTARDNRHSSSMLVSPLVVY